MNLARDEEKRSAETIEGEEMTIVMTEDATTETAKMIAGERIAETTGETGETTIAIEAAVMID
jgi:hypothetical protein